VILCVSTKGIPRGPERNEEQGLMLLMLSICGYHHDSGVKLLLLCGKAVDRLALQRSVLTLDGSAAAYRRLS
jgi:hypothetical protein